MSTTFLWLEMSNIKLFVKVLTNRGNALVKGPSDLMLLHRFQVRILYVPIY